MIKTKRTNWWRPSPVSLSHQSTRPTGPLVHYSVTFTFTRGQRLTFSGQLMFWRQLQRLQSKTILRFESFEARLEKDETRSAMPSLQNADSLQGGRPRYHEESSQGDHSSSHFPLEVLFFFFFSQVEHDMVRYEVELMLHLCLISKREHDTIIKTLTFRLDQFVMEGKIENQVDLFQVKPKCEDVEKENALVDATLDETVYK